MSIIIEDMIMPKSCVACPFEHNGDCYGGKPKLIMDIEDFKGSRHPDCPLMEAEPIKHGRWIRKTEQLKDCTVYWYVCSECGERPLHGRLRADDALTNYCPNCGTKMDAPNNARWIKQPNGEYKCSICGDTTLAPLYECGTCGAQMMSEVEE